MAVPKGGRAKQGTVADPDGLHGVVVGTRLKSAHVVTVYQVQDTGLTSGDQEPWVRAGLVGEENRAARSEVLVLAIHSGFLRRCEEVGDAESAILEGESEDGVAI